MSSFGERFARGNGRFFGSGNTATIQIAAVHNTGQFGTSLAMVDISN